jgi:hypothetical protein
MDQDFARMIIANIVAHDYDGTETCTDDHAAANIANAASAGHPATLGAPEAIQVLGHELAAQIYRELWVEYHFDRHDEI